jgi:cytochrome bd-type quinol oxidase subunit 2
MRADNIQSTSGSSSTWFEAFKRQGYYFQPVAIATILGGLYLHITRLFLGDDLLIQYVFTPFYDRVLTVPMAYAGMTGLLIWNQIQFRNQWHKVVYGLALFYIAGSVPLHVWNAYLNNSTEYIRWFPLWWTYLLLPLYLAIIVLIWRLRYK